MKKIKNILIFLLIAVMLDISAVCAQEDKKGRETDGIYVPYGTCLDYYTQDDIKKAADNLFSMLDPKSEDTKDVYKLYNDGYYLEAMIVFRNYMVDRIRQTPIYGVLANEGAYSWNRWYGQACVIAGDWTLEEYNNMFLNRYEKGDMKPVIDVIGYTNFIDPDLKMDLNWTAVPPDTNEAITQPTYGGISGRIASAYAQFHDEKYLKKWFQVMESYATQYRAQQEASQPGYSEMSPEERLAYQIAHEKDWTKGYEPMTARYAGHNIHFLQKAADIIGGLAIVIKCLPNEEKAMPSGYEGFRWSLSADSTFTGTLDEETYDLIDPVRFALISYHLITGEFYRLGAYRISPGHIVNQQIEGTTNYFRYMCLFKDFTFCNQWIDDTVKILNDNVIGSFYQDGGVLEKAFNYNRGTVDTAAGIARIAQMAPEFLSKLGKISTLEKYWGRLQEGYTSNTGIIPNVGNESNVGTPDIWNNIENKTKMENSLAGNKALGYNSVAYPYSGYVALRNGWNTDDLYLSFFNNDYRSSGHLITGTNAILSLSAYGRTMLVSGGAPWYGYEYVSSQKFIDTWYDEINGYFQERSSRKLCTVMVNGKSQEGSNKAYSPVLKRGYIISGAENLVKKVPDEPLNYRFGTNDSFDFTEGEWQGGYTYEDAEKVIYQAETHNENDAGRMADHKRSVIMVKDADLWLVFDEMKNMNGRKNTYSQIWNFAAYNEENENLSGYTDEQVVLDKENNIVKTQDENGPNLNIMCISDSDLDYKKYYGTLEEGKTSLGWSKGGKNSDMGGYTPRADVHVNWSDSGEIGKTTKVLSILSPSKDTSNNVLKYENLSQGDDIHYYIETADGIKIDYYSSPEYKIYKRNSAEIMAKSLLLTQKDSIIKGMVFDGEYIQINGVTSKYNTYKDFMFEIGKNNTLENTTEIAVPDTFEWVENADGSYTPVYNERQKKDALRIGAKKPLEFHDIDNHWAKEEIEFLTDKKIIDKALVFYPDKNITRGDFAVMIVKALGKGETEYKNVFTDVKASMVNSGYIQTAYDLNILQGSDGNANLNNNLTREQMCKIISIAFGLNEFSETVDFADNDDISGWAMPYVKAAYNSGVIQGNNNRFNPQGNLTRAEAAKVICNLIK